MNILGLNAYHADSSACVVRDGKLVAAAEEERFRRVKHWAGIPSEAVRYCLRGSGLRLSDIDHIAINRQPGAHVIKKALYAFSKKPDLDLVRDRLKNAAHVGDIRKALAESLGEPEPRARVRQVEHHRAHMASAFLVSPFEEAAVVSVDGFGDFMSAMWADGKGSRLKTLGQVHFPHSLGLLYLAITQYLGFTRYGEEYKVMGLAAYGKPSEEIDLSRLVRLKDDGGFELDLSYFTHHSEGVSMLWNGGEPSIGTVYSDKLLQWLGPARRPDEPVGDRHKALAASLQKVYEGAFFHLLNRVQKNTGSTRLCLAGGCALNSVANGKIFERTDFRELYVQAAAGDAGGAIGAAFETWHALSGAPRAFRMEHAYWGPEFSAAEIAKTLGSQAPALRDQGCAMQTAKSESALYDWTASRIAEGLVVGWFQGRMEWGPRALGNRSIVGDPRRADMKDILNLKIKRRESFRPFAPSVLAEKAAEWFETDHEVPFMLEVRPVRPEKRAQIPAVTHVDGSGRLQTVTRAQNARYHALLSAFERKTGVPMVLNTSFNENEPIVCRPEEAIDCFLRTRMDVLVVGDAVLTRGAPAKEAL